MDFTDLLIGLRNLDEVALEQFLTKYSPIILSHIRRNVKNGDAEDATQEFFYHILKVNLFAKFAGENEAMFCAYLLRSALNFAANWRMKKSRMDKRTDAFDADNPQHWRVLAGSGDTILDNIVRREIGDSLNRAIAQLDDRYREVIELKLLDYSNAEIAEILGKPLGSVNSWYTRALNHLRKKLEKLHTAFTLGGL